MKSKVYPRCLFILVALLAGQMNMYSQNTGSVINGPASVCEGSTGVVYTAPASMIAYNWAVSGGLTFVVNAATPDVLTIDWTMSGTYTLSVDDGVNPPVTLDVTVNPKATITEPLDPVTGMPVVLKSGANTGMVYTTLPGMEPYTWKVSPAGTIVSGSGTNSITVNWAGVQAQQSVSVTMTDPNGCSDPTLYLVLNYFPFPGPIDPGSIPQFVDPLPHFAAGLRVNAKNGGDLIVKTVPVKQVALPTGMTVGNGTIGDPLTPDAGKGNYVAYAISRDYGKSWGIPMWPAQTIEAKQGNQLKVQYINGLVGKTYADFNILADQTLMMNGYPMPVNPLTEPYMGQIPMVVHLHGGEIPSDSDGGPNSWFMPDGITNGPGFPFGASSLVTYPNQQEAATLWYHPHDDGLTRINVYTGLAGYYFLRGDDEELAQLPGWSGDDKVVEATPPGKTPTFNGANAYLPEIELGIQDRMFDVNGALYWPVAPPNPELHPFWTPEFIGDIFVVNGKTWPYLSVAPRKYRFRILDGCNARWLNMWLEEAVALGGTPGLAPAITVIGVEGGLLSNPVTLNPALGQYLNIGPGQRADVVIDFSAFAGKTFTLKQNASAPFPFGDPAAPGLTDVIMQFVVNGSMVSAANPTLPGTDKSQLPLNLRPATPMVKLTDFAGKVDPAITPAVHRQIILNEVMSFGGPAAVLVNNTYFEAALAVAGDPNAAGGPTEFPTEGTTEIIEIANVSADAHPMHIHLMQWQLVSRTPIDDIGYLQAYAAAWAGNGRNLPNYPAGSMNYPGGAGSPFNYGKAHVLPPAVPVADFVNTDGAVGGNPAFSSFATGAPIPASPEEQGWKDNVTVLPGYISKFVMRVAPTDKPVNATPAELMFPFDPSLGPGYVWHCHVIDHEDMSMMRPMEIQPSPLRLINPQITTQPLPKTACAGDALTYSVTATNTTGYQWQVSIDGGKTWTNLANVAPYSGTTTSSLGIAPVDLLFSGYKYRCILTNATPGAVTTSNPTPLTVNACSISGTLNYNNATLDPLAGFTVSVNGKIAVTDIAGAYIINNATSGVYPVVVTTPMLPGGINSTDAGAVNAYALAPVEIPNVSYMAGDVDNSTLINALDATSIQNNFVLATPFIRAPWAFWEAGATGLINPPPFTSAVNGESVTGFNILGMSTGDFNGSYKPNVVGGASNVTLNYSGTILSVPATGAFTLPLTLSPNSSQLTVGAVSLILNIPTNLVAVQGVTIAGSTVLPTFLAAGSKLTIGWNSTTPVTVLPGAPLVNITMVPKGGFTNLQTLSVSMAPNPLNEIADGSFVPILNAGLLVDQVKTLAPAPSSTLKVTVSPNPATANILITYQLPAAGTVTITIVASKGTFMKALLTNVPQGPGTFTLSENVTGLLPGQYTVNLIHTVAGKIKTTSTKFVKQ